MTDRPLRLVANLRRYFKEADAVTIAEALELTALVARKQPERDGRFAAPRKRY